ncbi:hypothetical protein IA69_10890 [Massilia sp. JS1662]|nr:SMI1/KNR4 family protein [Massilia sp. JS1662]KGF81757.1 hypothetical protein IA69_10890 [Massilia sp. JS1662]
MNFDDIQRQIASENGVPGTPADKALFEQVERRYSINLPTDVKQNYLIMNGSQSYTSGFGSWMRFWPLEEWRPAIEEFPGDSAAKYLSRQTFVCADWGIECVYFVIDLDELSPTFGHVYGLGATRPGLAASSFSEFVARVCVDSDELHSYE